MLVDSRCAPYAAATYQPNLSTLASLYFVVESIKMTTKQIWVRDRQPVGCICITGAADDAERHAADELQRYLKLISGAELPIVEGLSDRKTPAIILVNASRPSHLTHVADCPVDQLCDDGYAIHSTGADLIITSREPSGIVHGMYQYLSRVLGASFFDMGLEGCDLPQQSTIAHEPISIVKNPTLRYRGMQMAYGSRRLDWMAQNGFNWVRMGNDNDLEWWDQKLHELAPEYRKRGIRITFGHHSFQMIMPVNRYGSDNPEYFEQVDGKPVKRAQFNWSLKHRKVIDEVTWRIDWFLKRHPEIEQFDFWPTDGVCDVDEDDYRTWTGETMPTDWPDKDQLAGVSLTARLGDPRKARLYAMMTQEVAAALADHHPRVQFIITAYADLTQPCPQTPLPTNVTCTIAMYWRCYRHTLFDEGCVYNDQYRQIVKEWTDMYGEQGVYLSEYYMGMGIHVSLPYPIVTTIFREWKTLRSLGITGAKVNTGREIDRCEVPYNLNYLAFAATVWEDFDDAEAFLESYCRRHFGDAWEPLLALHQLWEQNTQEAEHTQPGYPTMYWIMDNQTIDRSRQLLLEAIAQTRNPLVINRAARLLMLVNYTAAVIEVGDLSVRRNAQINRGEDPSALEQEMLPWMTRMAEHFARLEALDIDVVGFIGDTEHMTAAEQRQKTNRWAADLARLEKADWVKDEFNPDILQGPKK